MSNGAHIDEVPAGYILEETCWGETMVLRTFADERPRIEVSREPTRRAAVARAWMDYHEAKASEHARVHLEEMQSFNA